MRYKLYVVICTLLCSIFLCSCNNDLSMEEQAWNEAVTYIEWFADKNNADLKPGVYSKDRVAENFDLNYTCTVAVTNSTGVYDQWYITVEKKSNGDWDVISVE